MATISVLDATGATQTVEAPNANGRAAASASRPVALSTEDKASIDAITAAFGTTEFYPETQPVSGTVAVSGSVAVTGPLTDEQLRAAAVPVSGTFWQATQPVSAASLPLPTGAATEAKQDALISAIENISPGGEGGGDASAANQDEQTALLTTIDSALAGTLAVSADALPLPTGAATESTLGAIEAALGGTLTVDGSGVTQPVSIAGSVAVTGTFWQATQPVSAASLPLPSGAATSAKQDSTIAAIEALAGSEYETVAASQTDQALGATGGAGDLLVSLLVIPATTSPGAISIKDGAGSAITVFTGGSDSVSTLHPFTIPLGIRSGSGAWSVTTGANVSVIAAGDFA